MSRPVPETGTASEPLLRQLSVFGLWLLVVNGMIGAGIFGLPADAARLAGSASPWIFVICAVLVLPVVLSFGQLASQFGNTGGPMLYAATAFGPLVGFQTGWAYYVARLTAFSANLSLLVATLGYFWPAADDPRMRALLLFATCALLVVINVIGARDAMRSLGLLTALKFLPLLLVIGFGIGHVDPGLLVPSANMLPSGSDLGAAIVLVIYAYVGFESGLVPAGEARHPERDMPRALLAALFSVSLLYAAVQWVCVAVLPDLGVASRPLVSVGAALLGAPGGLLIMAGIAVSVGGNLLGSMFSTSRVTYRLARDGYLPAWLGTVHPRHRTPTGSIVMYGVIGFLLALQGSFAWLAALSVLTRLLLYLCCIAAIPGVRAGVAAGGPAGSRAGAGVGAGPGMRLPGGHAIPALGALVCLGLLTQVNATAWLATAGFLVAGSLLYGIARRASRSRRANDADVTGTHSTP